MAKKKLIEQAFEADVDNSITIFDAFMVSRTSSTIETPNSVRTFPLVKEAEKEFQKYRATYSEAVRLSNECAKDFDPKKATQFCKNMRILRGYAQPE